MYKYVVFLKMLHYLTDNYIYVPLNSHSWKHNHLYKTYKNASLHIEAAGSLQYIKFHSITL